MVIGERMEPALVMDPEGYEDEWEIGSEPLCIEYVNTVGSRNGETPHEWFSSYSNLVAWGHLAGLLSVEQGLELRRRAAADPAAAESIL